VLGGTADRIAVERSNAAAKLKELQAIDSWRQRELIEAGGWATRRGILSASGLGR
jgi:hypothetical protein